MNAKSLFCSAMLLFAVLFLELPAQEAEPTDAAAALEVFSKVEDITEARSTLQEIRKDVRREVKIPEYDSLLKARETLGAIHGIVHRRPLVHEDCVDRAIRYLAAAEELGLALRIFAAGDHVFVSLKGSYYDLGWEPNKGTLLSHKAVKEKYHISQAEIDNGVFLVPLDRAGLQSIVYNTVASTLMERGAKEKALEAIEKAIALNPKNPLPYAVRGELYSRLEKPEAAIADFEKASNLFGAFDTALWELAMLRNQQEEYSKSVAALDQILRYYPGTQRVRENTRVYRR